eukprot:6319150-Pyramimonas_sp.AAC.1
MSPQNQINALCYGPHRRLHQPNLNASTPQPLVPASATTLGVCFQKSFACPPMGGAAPLD